MRSPRFERWFAQRNDLAVADVSTMWNGDTYSDYQYHVELAWAAWQEAVNGVPR